MLGTEQISDLFGAVFKGRGVPARLQGVDISPEVLFAADGYLPIWLLQINHLSREIFPKTRLKPGTSVSDPEAHFRVRVTAAGNVPTEVMLLMLDYTLETLQGTRLDCVPVDELVNTWVPRINAVLKNSPRLAHGQ